MNITDTMRPQTGTINFETEGKHHDLRVSSLPICDGEKIVLSIKLIAHWGNKATFLCESSLFFNSKCKIQNRV